MAKGVMMSEFPLHLSTFFLRRSVQGCDRRADGECSYGHMFGDF